MSSKNPWELSELGKEAVNASRPFSFKNRESVIFINTGDVLKGKFLHKNRSKTDLLPGQAKKSLKDGDILLSEIRPANGRFAYVDFDANEFVVSTKFMVIESCGRIIPRFLYHILTSQNSLNEFQRIAESRSGTFPQITFDAIAHFPLHIPNKKQQIEIVKLLDGIQKRLDLLQETNTTLESIAQTIFKSWFIDFDPVRAKSEGRVPEGIDAETAALFPDSFEDSELGLMPKGWSIITLNSAYAINPTRKLKKDELAPYLDMANVPTSGHHPDIVINRKMGSGSKFMNGDTLLARITPCLENGKTAFVDFLLDNQVGWGSTEFLVLRPRIPLPLYHGYLLSRHAPFREFAIQSMSGTSGRQRIQNDVLGRYPVVIPTYKINEVFNTIVTSIQEKITSNAEQIHTLSGLRDTLLPRLISGQLQLPDKLIKEDAK